ncbi:MAG: hypothetical protein ACK5VB_03495 [Bacteroidota bacterium]
MIKYTSSKQLAVDGFDTEFRQKLNPNNKWVILADAIPWVTPRPTPPCFSGSF